MSAEGYPVRVIDLKQTSDAFPSQWEGRAEDGRHVYIRYRHGRLNAGLGADADRAVDAAFPDSLAGTGGTLLYDGEVVTLMGDGRMSLRELAQALRGLAVIG